MNYIISKSSTQNTYGLPSISLQRMIDMMTGAPILGVDTETTGLSFVDNNLLMLQIFDGENGYMVDCQTVDITPLKSFFLDKNIVKIFHNAKFDLKFLRAAGIKTENVYDTMLGEKIIHNGKNMRFSLQAVMHKYFDVAMDKDVRSSFINHKGDFTEAQIIYGLDDVNHLEEIMKLQQEQHDKLGLDKTVWLEMNAVQVFADIEYEGLYLDKDAWNANADINKAKADKLQLELDESLLKEHPEYDSGQIDLFGEGRRCMMNWDSPSQVLKLLRNYDDKLESVGGPAVKELAKDYSFIRKYVEYKEVSKAYNAYGPKFYKYLHSDNKVHTNFRQILDTGRVSSSNPNMQQIPADNAFRNAFIPEHNDWVFVSSDFSAQELCIIAYGSQDPVWLKVLRDGGDLHGTCAELIFGKQWTSLGIDNSARKETSEGKKLRTHVKTLNFGLAYGMGAFSLAKQLDISEKDAEDLIQKYFTTFPKIKGFLDNIGSYGAGNGHIRTYKPFRRLRLFEEWRGKETDKSYMAKVIRASKNTPIQGTGADMTKLALVLLHRKIKNLDWCKIVLTVHDEINCVCHKDRAEEFSELLTSTMERAAEHIVGPGLLRCDAEISREWKK